MYSDIELRETQFINIGFGLADSNPVRRTTGEQARLLNQKIDQCANVIVRTDRLQPRGGTRGADEFDRAFAAINWPPRADAALDPAKGESPRTYSLPVSRRTLCENSDAELARRISISISSLRRPIALVDATAWTPKRTPASISCCSSEVYFSPFQNVNLFQPFQNVNLIGYDAMSYAWGTSWPQQ